jgi:hypothetical protein
MATGIITIYDFNTRHDAEIDNITQSRARFRSTSRPVFPRRIESYSEEDRPEQHLMLFKSGGPASAPSRWWLFYDTDKKVTHVITFEDGTKLTAGIEDAEWCLNVLNKYISNGYDIKGALEAEEMEHIDLDDDMLDI